MVFGLEPILRHCSALPIIGSSNSFSSPIIIFILAWTSLVYLLPEERSMTASANIPNVRVIASLFQEHLQKQLSSKSRNVLKQFISHGIERGSVGIEPCMALSHVRTLNDILAICLQEGSRKARFLNSVQKKFKDRLLGQPREWYCFLSRYTRMGYLDSSLTMQGLAQISESGFTNFSPLQLVGVLEIVDRQGLHVPDLALHVARQCWGHPQEASRSLIMRRLANIGVEIPSEFVESLNPTSIGDLINAAYTSILNHSNIRPTPGMDKHVLGLLKHLTSHQSLWREFLMANPHHWRDLHIIRHALIYAHTSIYDLASPLMKDSLALICTSLCGPLNPRRSGPPAGRFVDNLSAVLLKQRVAHQKSVSLGPFNVDILERDSKIVWHCNSPNRYYTADGATKRLRSYYELQEVILRNMGYTVINIPYWQWANIRNSKTRGDYCRTNRFLALRDVRIQSPGIQAELDVNPVLFNARTGASISPDFNNNQGETFFKKGAPRQAWVWNRPNSTNTPLRVSI